MPSPRDHIETQVFDPPVADGLGIVTNGVLCVTGLELTADVWAARHVTEH